jgi:hypothetical protein
MVLERTGTSGPHPPRLTVSTDVATTPIWLTMGTDTGPFGELLIRQLNRELGSGHARHQRT